MATSGVKVTGLKELQKFLDQLPAKVEQNIMRGAMRAGAKVLLGQAVANVPHDTGALRDSLRITSRSRKGKGVVTTSVKSDLFYARMVEYGTAAHWISIKEIDKPTKTTRSGTRSYSMRTLNKMVARGSLVIGGTFVGESVHHPGAAPRPFMRPALDGGSTEALVAVGNYIKKRLATKHGLDTSGIAVGAEE